MALTDINRFVVTTGSAPETGGAGAIFVGSDSSVAYRLTISGKLTDVIQGSINDILARWAKNSGFVLTLTENNATLPTVSPTTGGVAGGTAVTLTGTNFPVGTTPIVLFGTVAASNVVVVSATSITCVSPANPAGAVGITINGATGSVTKPTAFTYS